MRSRCRLDTDPGVYKLTMSLYDPDTLDPLPILNTTTGDLADESNHDIALLRVGAAPEAASLFPVPWQFGNIFALSGVTLPETVTPGSDVPLTLHWESLAETATDYTVFVHVVDSEGGLIAQQDRPPMGGFAPTHTWSPGLQIDDTLAIPLPADLTPGPYEVRAGLYVGDSRLPVSQDGTPRGDYAVVGVVEVQ